PLRQGAGFHDLAVQPEALMDPTDATPRCHQSACHSGLKPTSAVYKLTETVLARGAAVLLLKQVNRGHESAKFAVNVTDGDHDERQT
ncbi:MAG: hypothetical protein ABGZ53_17850, partial [Fuerstiella sp.]